MFDFLIQNCCFIF